MVYLMLIYPCYYSHLTNCAKKTNNDIKKNKNLKVTLYLSNVTLVLIM